MGAQWSPIVLVPKQGLISSMGLDVIHHRGRRDQPLAFAVTTERMTPEEPEPCLLPLVSVTALGTGLCIGAPSAWLHDGNPASLGGADTGLECLQAHRRIQSTTSMTME
jgi:hypothetical protein